MKSEFLATVLLLSAICIIASPLSAYDADTVTMYEMNSPTAMKRIGDGCFDVIFRGFGSRKKKLIDKDELLGFHFLLDTDCMSWGLRALTSKYQKEGLEFKAALKKAKKAHTRQLIDLFRHYASRKTLYENKPLSECNADKINHESHFIFTSPNIGVAKMYGPIILVIEEKRFRGMDLNGIAKDSDYYTFSRLLKNVTRGRLKVILADYFADRDEYVIPSFVSPQDISGLIVHTPSPIVIGNRIAVPQPAVKRVYRKHYVKGAMVIDVFDGKDRLIKRLTTASSASKNLKSGEMSKEELPQFISEAWEKYVSKRRRGLRR